MVETYIVPSPNTGEKRRLVQPLLPIKEGFRDIFEAETPVRIELPLTIFHECLSDIPKLSSNGYS